MEEKDASIADLAIDALDEEFGIGPGEVARIVGPEDRPHALFRRGLDDLGIETSAGRAAEAGADARGRFDHVATPTELLAHLGDGQVVEVLVEKGVIADFMALGDLFLDQSGIFLHHLADDEEGGVDAKAAQESEQRWGLSRVGAVVEREGDGFRLDRIFDEAKSPGRPFQGGDLRLEIDAGSTDSGALMEEEGGEDLQSGHAFLLS